MGRCATYGCNGDTSRQVNVFSSIRCCIINGLQEGVAGRIGLSKIFSRERNYSIHGIVCCPVVLILFAFFAGVVIVVSWINEQVEGIVVKHELRTVFLVHGTPCFQSSVIDATCIVITSIESCSCTIVGFNDILSDIFLPREQVRQLLLLQTSNLVQLICSYIAHLFKSSSINCCNTICSKNRIDFSNKRADVAIDIREMGRLFTRCHHRVDVNVLRCTETDGLSTDQCLGNVAGLCGLCSFRLR